MHNDKSYTTPVWWLSMIISLKLVLYIISIVSAFRYSAVVGEPWDEFSQGDINQLTGVLVVVVAALAEAITYWKIRTLIVRKKLVWWHLAGWISNGIILPASNNVVNWWLGTQRLGDNTSTDFLNAYHMITGLVVPLLILIGHVCFVMVLVDAYRKKKARLTSQPAVGQDILSDHA